MWSRLKKKKSFLDDDGAQAPAVSPPIIHLSLEKDLFVGAKKSSVVALEVPKVGVETVDLELQWEISVRHATLGFSATFIHDSSSTDRSATRALETNIKIGNNEDSEDEVDLTASTTGDFADEDNAATSLSSERRGPGAGVRRRMRNLLRRGNSGKDNLSGQDEESTSALNGVQLATNINMTSVHDYDRVCRGEALKGKFRLGRTSGQLIFTLDNSFSKTRRKRVLIKLIVKTFSEEVAELEREKELRDIHILRESVLSQVPDPSGYLSSDLNVKRFLNARPGE